MTSSSALFGGYYTPGKKPPVGSTYFGIKTTDHDGWLLWTNGRTLSRTDYATLWALVGSGLISGGVFGNGDGSTTFTLGNMAGRVIGAAGASSSGISQRNLGDTAGSESLGHTNNKILGSVADSNQDFTNDGSNLQPTAFLNLFIYAG